MLVRQPATWNWFLAVVLVGVPKIDCRLDAETVELLKVMENLIRASTNR
jgi:hypothetical protein